MIVTGYRRRERTSRRSGITITRRVFPRRQLEAYLAGQVAGQRQGKPHISARFAA